ncbi:putative major facilitator superfamily transporter protein [Phaeoacremonium minimum UCRPA7]|uniref:Putative major facilitator superfamily transporter protein n=1 Tax=Phaeoacremonium minimum (strain UCR-PA7) TaxID=1286976 RepID=R8B8K6_PHAM7|nr:putative major facilitator superfamily transporter protein [Phaeoacremonium minimum UCRPA7]EON95631.1 putative major facilitator superfamily transporter protein [Phaeoacremonium minimum UCRPA7]
MADEKTTPGVQEAPPSSSPTTHPVGEPIPRPAGWMYKGFRFGGKREFWYASPQVQLIMVAMVCFLCPGMFNALGGLGGGGQVDAKAQDDANTALYSTFAVVGFFSGTFANRLGVKLTMSLGGLGYCIYAASFLSYSHTQNDGFVVFAGAFLGVCAGLLWCGQGAIMMSYPPEDKKGRYIARFWIIFNMGAVIGALIPLGENIHKTAGAVTDGTYAAFIVLMFAGAVIALFLCNANSIQRDDGSHVILMKNPSWWSELKGLYETIISDPWILFLFPMFFVSNTFYTWQMNDMNGAHFNVRTRALNNVLYWAAQIFGAVIFGFALDFARIRRSVRARIAFGALVTLTFVVWGGGWAWQKQQPTREVVEAVDADGNPTYTGRADWTDGGKKFIGPMFLYIFMGFFDAAWQTCIYWYMGALSNSGRKAANFAGFYKGIQSVGNAIFWRLDGLKKPYNTIFGATWGTLGAALVFAAPIILLRIKDTISLEEDLKYTDETVEDVAPVDVLPHHTDKAEV